MPQGTIASVPESVPESESESDDIWDTADAPDETSRALDARRTKIIALSGLAAVVLITIVTIVLVSVLVDTSPHPATPAAAAEQWGDAVVHSRTTRQHALECDGKPPDRKGLELLTNVASAVHAGPARRTGTDRWQIRLYLDGLGAGAFYPVVVVRRSGSYRVC